MSCVEHTDSAKNQPLNCHQKGVKREKATDIKIKTMTFRNLPRSVRWKIINAYVGAKTWFWSTDDEKSKWY